MERIMATLTDEKQSLTRAVLITGVSTRRASLARVVGIHLDSHRTVQECFIGNHGLQLSKRPLRVTGICLTLLLGRFLALLAFGALTNICQIFQNGRWVLLSWCYSPPDNAFRRRLPPRWYGSGV